MKDPNQERIGNPRRFDLGGPCRSPLPEVPVPPAAELREDREDGPRTRHFLHRFFEELLRRSEH